MKLKTSSKITPLVDPIIPKGQSSYHVVNRRTGKEFYTRDMETVWLARQNPDVYELRFVSKTPDAAKILFLKNE